MPTVGEMRETLRQAVATAQGAVTAAPGDAAALALSHSASQALQRWELANVSRPDGELSLDPSGGPAAGSRVGSGPSPEQRAAGAAAAKATAAQPTAETVRAAEAVLLQEAQRVERAEAASAARAAAAGPATLVEAGTTGGPDARARVME